MPTSPEQPDRQRPAGSSSSPTPPTPPSASSAAPAAASVLALLQALGRRSSPQPAAVLARDLGLPRSTTYKLLGVLAEAGFVTHSSTTRRWGLGVAAYELGSAYSRQQPLQRAARSVMAELADRTGECAHLAVLHGSDVLYIVEERPLGRSPLVTEVGVRLPATVTASGLAILAALPAAQVRALFPTSDALVQRHEGSPSSLTGLRSELTAVRARGFAREEGTVTPGFASLGCAVLDHNGLPAAAVAVTWELRRAANEAMILDATRDAAASLTSRIHGS